MEQICVDGSRSRRQIIPPITFGGGAEGVLALVVSDQSITREKFGFVDGEVVAL